ncbi:hypothetical protein VKT23_019263 [Stygiomarasmius scandens]|uniref:Ricin B lectin domain-containing protein n=1 Tax=Marasmiellus scandens TaxID=2682957 RepID=A0ABR1IQU5_9AGAR
MSNPHLCPQTYYTLINLQSNTAMDLSAGDWRSIIGWPSHSGSSPGANQQWEFEPLGPGWSLRCVFMEESHKYISSDVGMEDKKKYLKYMAPSQNGLRHTGPLVASGFPVAWEVERVNWPSGTRSDEKGNENEEVILKIRWPRPVGDSQGRGLVVEMADWGSNRGGTKVQLADEIRAIHPCQLWRLVECGKRPVPAPPAYASASKEGDALGKNAAAGASTQEATTTNPNTIVASTTTAGDSDSDHDPNAITATSTSTSTSSSTSTSTSTATSSPSHPEAQGQASNSAARRLKDHAKPSQLRQQGQNQTQVIPQLGYTICSLCRKITSESPLQLADSDRSNNASGERDDFVSAVSTPKIVPEQLSSLRLGANGAESSAGEGQTEWDLLSNSSASGEEEESDVTSSEGEDVGGGDGDTDADADKRERKAGKAPAVTRTDSDDAPGPVPLQTYLDVGARTTEVVDGVKKDVPMKTTNTNIQDDRERDQGQVTTTEVNIDAEGMRMDKDGELKVTSTTTTTVTTTTTTTTETVTVTRVKRLGIS